MPVGPGSDAVARARTSVEEFGSSFEALLQGKLEIPKEGFRVNVGVKGVVSGPEFEGTATGVDYAYVRADGRMQLDVKVTITTVDGKNISFAARASAGLVLESNASTLNRIIHIRDREGRPGLIKRFMISAVPMGKSFKFLILDEAERLVDPAQHAMRRLMELYYRTCKVCIICNEPEKIIDYLRSRCSVFNFRPIKHEAMKRGLRRIITTENLKIDDLATDLIIKTSKGDLRKAINILQTAATTETIKPELIYTALNQFQSDRIKKMFYSAVQGQFLNADELLRELLKDNFPKEEILNIISSEIPHLKLRTKLKTELFEAVADTDYIITQSTNTDLQISSLLGNIALIGQRANMTSSPFHSNQDLS